MRYSKHNKTAEIAKLPRGMIVGSAAALLLVVAALTLTGPQPSTRKALPEFSLGAPAAPAVVAAKSDDKPLRLVYRNSVVPGGVHSAAELLEVMKRDPIVAAHYANFDVSKAHLVQVEQSRMVHVSYRIGDQIYWTKNKVRLALGEYLLSDGEHLIRARCGNRIADTVQGPVLDKEPAPEVLETAFVSADDLIDKTVSMAAMGGLPAQPGVIGGATPEAPSSATPAPAFNWDRYGMPALVSIPTLPGVTVVGGRGAPALLVDGVVQADPVTTPAGTEPVGTTPVVTGPAGTEPVGTTPVVTGPAATTPASNLPDNGTSAPIDVRTDLPASDAPGTPFIEAPTFTPAPTIVPVQELNGEVPEPGSAILALMALAMLFGARRLRRSKQ